MVGEGKRGGRLAGGCGAGLAGVAAGGGSLPSPAVACASLLPPLQGGGSPPHAPSPAPGTHACRRSYPAPAPALPAAAEEEALAALAAFPGVSIINDRANNRFPTPLDASNQVRAAPR